MGQETDFFPKKSIAIIPARGGSKRIPRKNIMDFCGAPIISYSIQAAIRSEMFDEIMVSTDDPEIAKLALKFGAKVPFIRNEELSSDTAGTAPVLIDVIQKYQELGFYFDYTCCIYPTAPFVTANKLKEAMTILIETGADSVLPVVKYSYPPQRSLVIRQNNVQMLFPENYEKRTQDFEPIFHDCGQYYIFKTESLTSQNKLFCANTVPIIVDDLETQDIDNINDWKIAELKYNMMR